MIIGIPKEIKDNENRVSLTPAGVYDLVQRGHEVLVEKGAGVGSGFSDEAYIAAGAKIVSSAADAWDAEMVMKVKEPLPSEFDYFKKDQILFTFLHLAAEPLLTKALMEKGVIAIAYETIQLANGTLPILTPMSEVAGRMSVQIGAHFLEKHAGGKGMLLGGVPSVAPANVVIIGGGVVGTNAAKMALGLGADVTILDTNVERLRQLDDLFEGKVRTCFSNLFNVEEQVKRADLLIGAVLIPGARTPRIVSEKMVKQMTPGSVIIDVAVDQGGAIETIDRITTHSNPVYEKHGVLHYAVANIPGAVSRTSTIALSNVTVPYALQIANKGYERACLENTALLKGLNVIAGQITYKAVAEAHNVPYTPVEKLLEVTVG
ncbi:alanine dehydrogenase [Calidifontibacillus erzurumensis]|uniref:Alanine dehydrogenase n=1 Tax=Calidifontibacillus erzurumensis TaxID=2741433 RepID=A0A8J8GH32_9BACI|nr:alanine dehydrogenase [Calidifontibacillus erzurumensis]NSL52175.1 alanine dehydrogenase [Calidifontibacillus erzurumensis]